MGELLFCSYCFAHWVAFVLVAIYQQRLFESWWLLDYFLMAIIIVWLNVFQLTFLCSLMEKVRK